MGRKITAKQADELSRRCSELCDLVRRGVVQWDQAMSALGDLIPAVDPLPPDVYPVGIVVIPDLSPSDLVQRVGDEFAQRQTPLARIHPDFQSWDFTQYRVPEGDPSRGIEVRGETYDVFIWKSPGAKTLKEIRDFFASFGAEGNTAAMLAWIAQEKPEGLYITVPPSDDLLWRDPSSGELHVPHFVFYMTNMVRTLRFRNSQEPLDGRWRLLGFRKRPRPV